MGVSRARSGHLHEMNYLVQEFVSAYNYVIESSSELCFRGKPLGSVRSVKPSEIVSFYIPVDSVEQRVLAKTLFGKVFLEFTRYAETLPRNLRSWG